MKYSKKQLMEKYPGIWHYRPHPYNVLNLLKREIDLVNCDSAWYRENVIISYYLDDYSFRDYSWSSPSLNEEEVKRLIKLKTTLAAFQ